MISSEAELNKELKADGQAMNTFKLNPKSPNKCELHSHCPECEHLLQCSEDDSAWTGNTLEETRILSFASAFIQIGSCSEAKEDVFLRTFKTRITAELGICTSDDLNWAKIAIKTRKDKIEELERRFKEELDRIILEESDTALLREYAEKLDRYCGPIMTEEEYWEALR